MRATVTIDKDILDELVHESGHKNKATAVREAVAVYLRSKKTRKDKRHERQTEIRQDSRGNQTL